MSEALVRGGAVPEKAENDALHVAVAAVHGVDYLLTWNFRHLDNAEDEAGHESDLSGMEVRDTGDLYSAGIDGRGAGMSDEIIEEVWRIKDEIAREHGYDVGRLGAYFRRLGRERAQREEDGAAAGVGKAGEGTAVGTAQAVSWVEAEFGSGQGGGGDRVGKLMEPEGRKRVDPRTTEYRAALRRCFGAGQPASVTAWGPLQLVEDALLGFFCSVRAPGDVVLKTYDLARALRSKSVTLVGGFQSPMEREFLDLLLRGSARVVVCPARGLGVMRLPRAWKAALGDGRLLVLSFFDEGIRRPTAALAARRNACVAALADRLLVAHAAPGSKTEGLCRDALASGKRVFTLESSDNEHLVAQGAVAVAADDPAACMGDGVVGAA